MRKNVLLVLPKVPGAMAMWNVPPIGILYISSSIKKKGFNVYTLNLMLEEGSIQSALENAIKENKIDILGTGDLVLNYKAVKEVVDIAKKFSPEITTIIGGGLVTHSPEEAMKIINNADYGIIGEGELSMSELIFALENSHDTSNIKGIIYRKDDDVICTEIRDDIENLDSIPFPDYDGFDYFEFAKKLSSNGNITALLTTSRSCPFRCTFCSSSGGKKYRQRSLNNIFEELEFLISKYHVNQIFLNDELFAVNAERVNEFCERVKKYNIQWLIYLRISKNIQLDLLKKMNDSGCICVFYGLESASNKVLKSMNKGTTVEEMKRVLEITKEAGLKAKGDFIFGDTSETKETIKETLSWIEGNIGLLGNVSISPIVLFPGSELYYRAVRNKKIINTVEFIKAGCPLINPSDYLTETEYEYLVNQQLPSFAVHLHNQNSALYQKNLHENLIVDSSKKRYIYEFVCSNCNEKIINFLQPTMISQASIICKNCNEKYERFLSYLYFTSFEKEITLILKKDKVAIWGCGETLEYLYSFNSYIRENDIILFDSNKIKQRFGFHGKIVYCPEMIDEFDLKSIIFCVGNMNYGVISETIKEEYPKIKNTYWIYNLALLN